MGFSYLLSKVDFFQVPFTPSIAGNYTQQTAIGGCTSLLLALISALYCFYSLIQWTNSEMLTRVVTQELAISSMNSEFQNQTLRFFIYPTSYTIDTVNPFLRTNNIITPFYLDSFFDGTYRPKTAFNDDVDKHNLMQNYYEFEYQQDAVNYNFLYFAKCNQEYLAEGEWCAPQEVIDDFFAQKGNELYIEFTLRIVNPKTFASQDVKKLYSLRIESDYCQSILFEFTPTQYILDRGEIIGTTEIFDALSELKYQTSTNSHSYCQGNYGVPNIIGVIYSALDEIYTEKTFQYPNIFEVLANVESIISGLFVLKYIILELNRYVMRSEMLDQLLEQYYPEIKQFIIQYNWLGKIKSIRLQNKRITVTSYYNFRKKLKSILQCKLSFVNMNYEISRLQIVVQSLTKREKIQQVHSVGVRLDLKDSEGSIGMFDIIAEGDIGQKFYESRREHGNKILQQSDLILWSRETGECLNSEQVEQELEMEEFYQINRISKM